MPHVADDADDFVKFLSPIGADALPQRVFARKESLREHFADEHDLRVVAHLRRSEPAPLQKWDAHGAKIIVVDVAHIRMRVLPGICTPFDLEGKVRGLSARGSSVTNPTAWTPGSAATRSCNCSKKTAFLSGSA